MTIQQQQASDRPSVFGVDPSAVVQLEDEDESEIAVRTSGDVTSTGTAPAVAPSAPAQSEPEPEWELQLPDFIASEPVITLATAVSGTTGSTGRDTHVELSMETISDTVPLDDFIRDCLAAKGGHKQAAAALSNQQQQQRLSIVKKQTLPLWGLRFGYLVHELLPALGGRDALHGKTTGEVKDMIVQITNFNRKDDGKESSSSGEAAVAVGSSQAASSSVDAIKDQPSISLCEYMLHHHNRSDAVSLRADWYIIHPHSYVFLDVVESIEDFLLREHASQQEMRAQQQADRPVSPSSASNASNASSASSSASSNGSASQYSEQDYAKINDVVIWMDIFSLPQVQPSDGADNTNTESNASTITNTRQRSGSGSSDVSRGSFGNSIAGLGSGERTVEWFQHILVDTIQSIGNVLLVCLPTIQSLHKHVFTRAWCVYEMYACLHTHHNAAFGTHPNKHAPCRFELTSSAFDIHEFEHTLTHRGSKEFFDFIGHKRDTTNTTNTTNTNNKQTSSENPVETLERSKATLQTDTHNIHNALLLSILSSQTANTAASSSSSSAGSKAAQQQPHDQEVHVYKHLNAMLRTMLEQWLLALINRHLNPTTITRRRSISNTTNSVSASVSANADRLSAQSQAQAQALMQAASTVTATASDLLYKQSFWQFALADAYKQMNKAEVGLPVALLALESRVQTLGMDHVDTHALILFVGELYEQTAVTQPDNLSLAEQHYARCLQLTESKFGIESPACLLVCRRLYSLYKTAYPRTPQTLALCVRITGLCERIHGPEHAQTMDAWNDLALLYADTGRLLESESLLLRCVSVCERVHGPDHANTLTSLNHLARVSV
jgi:macrodomain Ter protein organizer (MatP/YcbG family)